MKSFFKRIRGRTAVRRFALLLPATLILIAATAFARPAWEKHRSAKASRNQSGRAAVKEFLFSPAKAGPPPLFTQLDTDGDGLLSPWEIEWATESLRAMDRNEDGWIENFEVLRYSGRDGQASSPPPTHPPAPWHHPPPPPHRQHHPHR
ncbi:MAG: hypothetical protein ISQ14_10195 [Verrucomicrobiae bacterium]|nr:hypothetical protein [Verrucomicrobiae bacterium]